MASSPEIRTLLAVIDRGYGTASWHGVNLRGSLRRISVAQAGWRPHPSRHNAWETVVHCAYWKYAVWRRLTGAARGSFPLTGSNWFQRPQAGSANERAWRADLELLARMHADLTAAVADVPVRSLHRRSRGFTTTPFDLISGVAAHDLYHAGQIQLLKALQKTAG